MKVLTLFIFMILVFPARANRPINSFTTDYCTNFPEGTRGKPELWKHCCLEHDLYFWAGGSKQNRYNADQRLRSCIRETGARRIAMLMYIGVRVGSYSPIKYPKRKWGNGWKARYPFKPLSIEEINTIESELSLNYDDISYDFKTHFISELRSRLD